MSHYNVEEIDREVLGLIRSLEKKTQGGIQQLDIGILKQEIKHIQSRLSAMSIESRSVTENQQNRYFKKAIKTHKERLNAVSAKIDWETAGKDYENDATNKMLDKYGNIAFNEDAAIKYGKDLQNQTLDICDNVLLDIEHTKLIASDCAKEVYAQTKQIDKINEDTLYVESEMDRAAGVIKR